MTDLRQAAQQALEAWDNAVLLAHDDLVQDRMDSLRTALEQQAEPVSMRMPKVGDKVICLEDESLGEVVSLTGGGSPDITFDDGTRGTYLLREFAELFSYVAAQGDKASFNGWWDGDYDDSENPYEPDSAAYWAWAGWQAAQRPWVGLTDDEITELDMEISGRTMDECVRAIEDKLKEKNDH